MIEFLNATANTWGALVLSASVQAAVVGAVVLLVARLKSVSAHLRYALLLLAVAKFVMPPMVAMPFGVASQFHFSSDQRLDPPITVSTSTSNRPDSVETETSTDAESANRSTGPGLRERLEEAGLSAQQQAGTPEGPSIPISVSTTSDRAHRVELTWAAWLMMLHIAGSACALVRVSVAALRLRLLLRTARPAGVDTEEAGDIRVLVSEQVHLPFSCGVLRRTIILPGSVAEELSEQQLQAVLRHEIAHHRRWDLLVNWLQILTTALWWFHPVLWFVNRELRRVREECCDDELLSEGDVNDEVYSETLIAVARLSVERSAHWPMAVGMAGSRHPLARRLERIMDPNVTRRRRLGLRNLLVVAILSAIALPGFSADDRATHADQSQNSSPDSSHSDDIESALTGVVRDQNGKPIAGASVCLLVREGWSTARDKGRALTNNDGTFAVHPKRFHLRPMTMITFVVSKPGHSMGFLQRLGKLPPRGCEVQLTPDRPSSCVIRSPNGEPIPNARIALNSARLGNRVVTFPPTGSNYTVSTDAAGTARLNSVVGGNVSAVTVSAPKFGVQRFYFRGDAIPEELRLRAAGRIAGQVESSADVDPTQMRIAIGTYGDRSSRAAATCNGTAIVRPDKSGRFEVPAIATGTVRGKVYVSSSFKGAESLPRDLAVAENRTTKIVVRVGRAVRVRRRLLAADDGTPIPGAMVVIEGQGLSRELVTDEDGQFTVWLKPNATYHSVYDVPHEFLHRPVGETRTIVGKAGGNLPALEFRRAKQITGVVVDADGEPASGVLVLADWNDPDATGGFAAIDAVNSKARATTDHKGRFTLQRVHPTENARLIALRHGVRVADDVVVRQQHSETKIEIGNLNFVSLEGKIANPEALEGGESRLLLYSNFSGQKSDRGRVFVTNIDVSSDGTFKTPAHFPARYAYRVVVQLNASQVASTKWMVPQTGSEGFAPLTISKRVVSKRAVVKQRPRSEMVRQVVNANRQPVGNADVIAWYLGARKRLKTDAGGSFTLPDVGKAGAWVFVDADGYRFHGQFIARRDKQPIVLSRRNEPDPLGPMRTLQTDKPSAALLRRVRNVHAKTLREYLKSPDFQQFRKDRARQAFVRLAPRHCNEFIKDRRRDIRTQIVAIAESDLDRALAEMLKQPKDQRLWTCASILRTNSMFSTEQRRRVINASLPLISDGPEDLTFWASAMRKCGMAADSKRMFDRALKRLPELGSSNRAPFTRGLFAWCYADVDYQKSLQLIEGVVDKRKRRRYLTNIAHELADSDPDAAVEVLGLLDNPDGVTFQLVATMAPKFGNPARSLAYGIKDPRYRAHALAYIADAHPQGKDARRLLRKAFDILTTEINAGDRTGTQVRNSLTTAVAILPIAERVAPNELREYFWRTLSFRRNVSYGSESRALGNYGEGQTARYADPVLALALSRYDRKAARQVALDPDDETLDLPAAHGPFRLFAVLAVLDPEATVRTIEKLPVETGAQLKAKLSACQQVSQVLASTVREQWRSVIEDQYILRDPTVVDF